MGLVLGLQLAINRAKRNGYGQPVITPKYYFSATGNDANDGLTDATPKQSLTELSSLVLEPSDIVGLKCGDSFEGTITVGQSGTSGNPITLTSYGTGAKPKIYGSESITGWTLHSGNIWKATFATTITQLFVNDARMQVARYPETGYATVDAAPTTSSLTVNALNGTLDYTGTICLIHSGSYAFDRRVVTSSSGTTLQLSSAPFENVNVGEYFILVGKLEFLTKAGQWYYDDATNTVYLWKLDGTEPTDTEVRGSTRDFCLNMTAKDYITVKNIEFLHAKVNGINATSVENFMVKNVAVADAEKSGIYVSSNSRYLSVENNTITGSNAFGIELFVENSEIKGNTVSNIGLLANLGLNGSGSWYMGSGIYCEGDYNVVEQNRVDEVAYNGIHFTKLNVISKNYISNFCRNKRDGGGIYTSIASNLGSEIKQNLVLNGWGLNGSDAEGIYIDEYSQSVTVENNTVGNCARGIFLHNGKNNVVRYNTIFNTENGLYVSKDGDGVQLNNNIVYGLTGQEVIHRNITTGTLTVNNNIYVNRYTSNPFELDWTNHYTFTNWKSTTGYDAASTFIGAALGVGESQRLIVNPTIAPKTYYVNNATAREIDGTSITTSFTLAAFASKIVEGTNLDCILDYADAVAPVITAFTLPATSATLVITPTTLVATGGAAAYKTTLTNVAPTLESSGWSTEPLVYAEAEGEQTFYVWARDAAGNISASASASCNVSGTAATIGTTSILSLTSATANAVRAYPVTMSEGGLLKSITIYHSAGNGSELIIGGVYADDGANHPSSLLATTAQTIISTSAEWQTIDFITPIYVEAGTKIWIGWNKNGASTLAYEAGSVTRASKNVTFGALPNPYGTADTYQNYGYSVYVNYLK